MLGEQGTSCSHALLSLFHCECRANRELDCNPCQEAMPPYPALLLVALMDQLSFGNKQCVTPHVVSVPAVRGLPHSSQGHMGADRTGAAMMTPSLFLPSPGINKTWKIPGTLSSARKSDKSPQWGP
jgi:hypothetical protein